MNKPNMVKVMSSNIDSIAYDETDDSLYVLFKNGACYKYDSVPKQVYYEMLNSPSVGKYYKDYVTGKYTSSRVD